MTIETDSIEFLEWHISNKYKEIFDNYLINNIEWIENEDGVRAIADLIDMEQNKLTNIIVLFPFFDKNNYKPNNIK